MVSSMPAVPAAYFAILGFLAIRYPLWERLPDQEVCDEPRSTG